MNPHFHPPPMVGVVNICPLHLLLIGPNLSLLVQGGFLFTKNEGLDWSYRTIHEHNSY